MKRCIFLLALLLPCSLLAQGTAPQIPLSGSIGVPGSASVLGYQSVAMTDANYTLNANQWAHGFIQFTGALTATRTVVAPLNPGQQYVVENSTTGGQSIVIGGATGTTVTVANGATINISTDGTNYYTVIASGGGSSVGAQGIMQTAAATSGQFAASQFGVDTATGNALQGPIVRTLSSWFPQQPIANFRTQLTNTGSVLKRVILIGDSITAGLVTPTLSDSYAYQLKSYLQAGHDGGSGLLGVGFNGGQSQGGAYYIRPEWTEAGTWTQVSDLGPSQTGTGFYGAVYEAAGTSNTLTTATVRGTLIGIDYEETTDNAGCSVTIDGTNVGTVDNTTNSTPIAGRSGFSVSAGTHTVVIAPSGTGKCYLYGVEGINATGVVVDNIAVGYMRSEAFGANTATQLAFVTSMSPAPALAVIDLGVNDSANGTGTTQAQYTTHMQAIITYLETLNPQISILLVDNYDVSEAGTTLTQAMIRASEQQLANADTHVSYMSMHDVWQSVSNANTLGLLASDTTHPSNAGGQSMGYEVASQIVGRPSSSSSGSTVTFNSLFPSTVANLESNPATNLSISAPTAGTFAPGINWYQSTSPGHTTSTGFAQFSAGQAGPAGFYLTSVTPNDGFKFCSYTNGTQLTAFTQLFCLTIPHPTANGTVPVLPATVTTPEQNLTFDPAASLTANAINPGFNFSTGSTSGYATGGTIGYDGTNAYPYFFRPANQQQIKSCTYTGGTAPSSLTAFTCSPLAALTANTNTTLPLTQIGSGTPVAGDYVDGGTGAWTPLPGGGSGFVTGTGSVPVNSSSPAGNVYTVSATVTGAATGSPVLVSPGSAAFATNCILTGYVTSANTVLVTVVFPTNFSTGGSTISNLPVVIAVF